MYHPVPEAATAVSGNDSGAAFTAVSAGLAAGCRAGGRGTSADPSGLTSRSASVLQADRAERSTFQSARGLAPFTEVG
jgi:hypothetical protein